MKVVGAWTNEPCGKAVIVKGKAGRNVLCRIGLHNFVIWNAAVGDPIREYRCRRCGAMKPQPVQAHYSGPDESIAIAFAERNRHRDDDIGAMARLVDKWKTRPPRRTPGAVGSRE